jgi:hypothetical protein
VLPPQVKDNKNLQRPEHLHLQFLLALQAFQRFVLVEVPEVLLVYLLPVEREEVFDM